MLWKKMCQHPLWGEDCEAGVYDRIAVKNHCWGSKTMSKGSSGQTRTKTGQYSNGIKSFGLTNQSLKSFDQIGRSICSERVATPCITPTIKHGRGSFKVGGGGLLLIANWGFPPDKRPIESDRLSQHTASSHNLIWNAACGSRICTPVR